MSEKVKVRIEAKQKIQYIQEMEIPKELYNKYLEMCEDSCDDMDFDREFGHLINPSDICDSDEYEDFYMTVSKS